MADTPVLKGATFHICATPQGSGLTQSEFEALTFIEAGSVVEHGSIEATENILSQNYLGTEWTKKQKGIKDGGAPSVIVGYDPDDTGHDALDTAADTNYSYAFKLELNDAPDALTTNTIIYYRSLITIPALQLGEVETFFNKTYALALQEGALLVKPEAI